MVFYFNSFSIEELAMNQQKLQSPVSNLVLILAMLFSSFASLRPTQTVQASHTPAPSSVTVAGSLQSELGCSGDWQADCAATHLTYDANDDVWQGSWIVPVGETASYEYKAALNN